MEYSTYSVYEDMESRTGGQLYIGVVGPVRTGKSTFIKRFMDLCVLPNMKDSYEATRVKDELPQSSGGKTITTTEPKFIPKDAARITLGEDIEMFVRLIDCVGYMVDGAVGHLEDGEERMVQTPWEEERIPFTMAAEIGTTKVIEDHSTVGIVITTDGSFGELDRKDYIKAEEKTMENVSKANKPYILIVNSAKPYSEETKQLTKSLSEKYGVNALSLNCEQLKKEDIFRILEELLLEFPLSSVEFYVPKWVEILPMEDEVKQSIIKAVKTFMSDKNTIKSIRECELVLDSPYIASVLIESISLATGIVKIKITMEEDLYYKKISELVGENIENEYEFMEILDRLSQMKEEYDKVLIAMNQVRNTGYGVVMPKQEEILLEQPQLIKHGSKYGVKVKAKSPSVHLIKAAIETEIAPIVGTKEQAEDLISYINAATNSENGVWQTNIFGKTIEQLVQEGIQGKINMIGEESQLKLQESMQKIVNDMNGGMVCIII